MANRVADVDIDEFDSNYVAMETSTSYQIRYIGNWSKSKKKYVAIAVITIILIAVTIAVIVAGVFWPDSSNSSSYLNKISIQTVQFPHNLTKLQMLEKYESKFANYSETNRRRVMLSSEIASVDSTLSETDNDYKWKGNIMLGSQTFDVLFDTGSSNLWVAGTECTDCVDATVLYSCDSDSSSTCSLCTCTTSSPCDECTYEKGSNEGYYVFDTININGATATIEFAVVTADSTGSVDDYSGILGLGYESSAVDDIEPPFVTLFNDNQFTYEKFAFYLAEGNNAELVLGGYDANHLTGTIYWYPLLEDGSDGYAIYLNSVTIVNSGTQYNHKTIAIVDTGTSYLMLPTTDYFSLETALLNGDYGVTLPEGSSYLEVSCDDYKTTLPVLYFQFGSPLTESTETVTETETTSKAFGLDPIYYVIEEDNVCKLAIDVYNGDAWILGTAFMREWYTIFDMTEERIAFAEAVQKVG